MNQFENIIGCLKTPTTTVEVIQTFQRGETEHTWKLKHPAFSLNFFPKSHWAKARYLELGVNNDALTPVGRVSFVTSDMELFARVSGGSFRQVRCAFDSDYYHRTLGRRGVLDERKLAWSLNVQSPLLQALMQRLMTETLNPGLTSGALADSLGHSMLMEWSHVMAMTDLGDRPRAGLQYQHIRMIEEIGYSSSDRIPNVGDLANACGFSRGHFGKLFRKHFGYSIGQYLRSVQLQHAQELLLGTDLPLKEIAARLGFANPSNFSSSFTSGTGITPRAFRGAQSSATRQRLFARFLNAGRVSGKARQ